jgi:hypothetical protein
LDADSGFVTIDPSGKFLYAIATGLFGGITADTIDSGTGIPTPVSGSPFQLPVGMSCALYPCFPISLVEDSTGRFLLVVAYDGFQVFQTVWTLSIDAASGALTTLGGSRQFGEGTTGLADFAIATSGTFVYVSVPSGLYDPILSCTRDWSASGSTRFAISARNRQWRLDGHGRRQVSLRSISQHEYDQRFRH